MCILCAAPLRQDSSASRLLGGDAFSPGYLCPILDLQSLRCSSENQTDVQSHSVQYDLHVLYIQQLQ